MEEEIRKLVVKMIKNYIDNILLNDKVMTIKVAVDSSIGDAVFEFKLPKDLEDAPKVQRIRGCGHIIPIESESYNKDTGIFTVSFKKVNKSYMWNIADCDVVIEIVC